MLGLCVLKLTIYVVLFVGIHMSRVILFLPLVVGPSPIRGYAHSHSAEVTRMIAHAALFSATWTTGMIAHAAVNK